MGLLWLLGALGGYTLTVLSVFHYDMGGAILWGCASIICTWMAGQALRGDSHHNHTHHHDHSSTHNYGGTGGQLTHASRSGGPFGGGHYVHDMREHHTVLTGAEIHYRHAGVQHIHHGKPVESIELQVAPIFVKKSDTLRRIIQGPNYKPREALPTPSALSLPAPERPVVALPVPQKHKVG